MPRSRQLEDRFKAQLPVHLQATQPPLIKQPDKNTALEVALCSLLSC